mgnify:CR=1 FL=1|jgi:hypothetical protein
MSQTQIQVTPTLSSVIKVTETDSQVTITRAQNASVVTTIATGPQGPPFVGSNFFDLGAITALNSGDIGKVLKFDGTNFIPTNELETNLTINGGAF